MESRLRMTCTVCGSTDVARDAWAVWDEELQTWHAGHIFDAAHCFACEGESNINEEVINDD